jgi:hypothetical protein
MKHYFIEYKTDSGIASYYGEFESLEAFIKEANEYAHESDLLPQDESVYDCALVLKW